MENIIQKGNVADYFERKVKDRKCDSQKDLVKLIRSFYNIKQIFSFLPENIKLNLIFYNKFFQNKFGIDKEYYKKKSGKYRIFEKDGSGREYKLKTNNLIFEGEYLNKKRNGKGKEYNYDFKGMQYLKFEGNYLNGKRNGKGKEYYASDELKFEGEYLNGERNGKGKFLIYGKISFEGEYLNDKPWNGKRKEYYDSDELKFEGEYLNGEKHGKGKEFYESGKLKFEGEYLKGKRGGKGKNITGIMN